MGSSKGKEIDMEKCVYTLPDATQRKVFIALAQKGLSLDDIVKGMNSRLCDLKDTIDVSSILKGD